MTPETKLKQEQERQPQKQSNIEAPSVEKTSFSISGILGSVFKGDAAQKQTTPTEHALPPAPVVAGPAPHEISATAAQPIVTNGVPENRQPVQKQASVETPSSEKSSFSLPGILGSVFKGGKAAQKQATPTDHALPPAPIVAGPAPHEVLATTDGMSENRPQVQKQASVETQSKEKSSFSLPGILGSVFKGGQKQSTPTDSAHPPGPIVAGSAPHKVSKPTSNGTREEQLSMSYEIDPDVQQSSSEELSQFHRTMVQESAPDPEARSRSDSPANQVPMLMSQAVKSSALQGKSGDAEERDDIVVEGKSSRSKKAKAKRKKKKKKTSATTSSEGDGESSLTTEEAISAFAASLLVDEERASKTPTTSTAPATEKEEERASGKTSSTIATTTTVTMATMREEEPPVSLDDFVDTVGTGGVEAAQPMPPLNNSQGEPSKTTNQSRTDGSLHGGGGLTEAVDTRESVHDSRESFEPFPSSKPGSLRGSKRNSLAVEDKPLLSDDVDASVESDKREENKKISTGEQRDSDHDLLSPEFVQKDLLSEALEELDRAGGVGGGRGGVMGVATEEKEEEAWLRERSSPSENVKNSLPESDRQRGFRDSSSPMQPVSLDDSSPHDQLEQQSIEKAPLSEEHHLSMHKTGNSSPESRNSPISRDKNDQAKSPLQSSSDTTIGARKGSAPGLLTGSWSTGQYNRLKSLSKKAGSGLKRPNLRWQSSAKERRRLQQKGKDMESLVDEFDIIELPKSRPAPEAPPPAGDMVCSPQDSN